MYTPSKEAKCVIDAIRGKLTDMEKEALQLVLDNAYMEGQREALRGVIGRSKEAA